MIEAMKQALEALEQLVPDDLKPYHKEADNAITALRHAIEQAEQSGHRDFRVPAPTAPAQPTFIKHEVESAEDWSDWVCPDPNEYLIKCCDCGLVHEAQFRVAEYKPTPSEEFVVTGNPDMQTQFRMKRHSSIVQQPLKGLK